MKQEPVPIASSICRFQSTHLPGVLDKLNQSTLHHALLAPRVASILAVVVGAAFLRGSLPDACAGHCHFSITRALYTNADTHDLRHFAPCECFLDGVQSSTPSGLAVQQHVIPAMVSIHRPRSHHSRHLVSSSSLVLGFLACTNACCRSLRCLVKLPRLIPFPRGTTVDHWSLATVDNRHQIRPKGICNHGNFSLSSSFGLRTRNHLAIAAALTFLASQQ